MTSPTLPSSSEDYATADEEGSTCIMVFNANDPSGAAGLAADLMAVASVGIHALTVITGAYARDTAEVIDHFALDDEAVSEQARVVLEDVPIQAIKVGFVGSAENISAIAEIASDYAEIPLIAYMPDLSWWREDQIETYQEAFCELLLPQATILVGNHSTLARWLLPEWSGEKAPSPRDIARAADNYGVAYTLVTGISLPEQHIDNVLASPSTVLCSHAYERFEASFFGAGETLSAALTALIASETELTEAVGEALGYLDRCLASGFRPGMGNVLPDRLFWAQPDDDEDDDAQDSASPAFDLPPSDTRH